MVRHNSLLTPPTAMDSELSRVAFRSQLSEAGVRNLESPSQGTADWNSTHCYWAHQEERALFTFAHTHHLLTILRVVTISTTREYHLPAPFSSIWKLFISSPYLLLTKTDLVVLCHCNTPTSSFHDRSMMLIEINI